MVLALLAVLAAAPTAGALKAPSPWNGTNPFRCQIQNAGFGTVVPHPEADPYCVEFDKRRQNIAQLGVVQFLSLEPARVAAAVPKCFYFQSDHWRGSIVQDDPATKTYQWDGHYFFDKATGDGGVWISNFRFNGQTADPRDLPGFPAEYRKYFGPGTGGVITHDKLQADPTCHEQARRAPQAVYAAAPASGAAPSETPAFGCLFPFGTLGFSHVGPVRLGTGVTRARVLLGVPNLVRGGFDRWCLASGASIRAGGGTTTMLLSTSPAYRVRGVGPGSSLGRLRAMFPRAELRARLGRIAVWGLWRSGAALAGVLHGRVIYIALYNPRALRTPGAVTGALRRAG